MGLIDWIVNNGRPQKLWTAPANCVSVNVYRDDVEYGPNSDHHNIMRASPTKEGTKNGSLVIHVVLRGNRSERAA